MYNVSYVLKFSYICLEIIMIYSQMKYYNDLHVLYLFNIVQLHIFINTIKKTLICLFWYLQDYRGLVLIISLTYIIVPYLIQKRKDILILVRNRRAPIYHSQQHYLSESRTIHQLSRHHSCNNQHHMCQYSP